MKRVPGLRSRAAATGRFRSNLARRLIQGALCLWVGGSLLPVLAFAQGSVAYRTEITGVGGALEDLIEQSSRLLSGEGQPPAGLAGLHSRAESDVEQFQRVLRSKGYYGASMKVSVDAESRPALVTIAIDTGPLFRLGSCTIAIEGPVPETMPRNCAAIGLETGVAAEAIRIVDAQARLLGPFRQNGFPDVDIARRAEVDHATSLMNVAFTVTPGPEVKLGAVRVSGNVRAEGDFLASLRSWNEGDIYDTRQLDAYRDRLSGLNLFDSIILTTEPEGADNRTLHLAVQERPPRTFGGGVRYASDQGFGVKGFWEHRNLYGEAEGLHVDLEFAQLKQALGAIYALPHRPGIDQRLEFAATVMDETTDAYRKRGGEISGALTTPLSKQWRARLSAVAQSYEVDEEDRIAPRTTLALSLPLSVTYDGADSLLDPKNGERLNIGATPVFGQSDGPLAFLRLEAEASHYLSLDEAGDAVIASRLRAGTLLGGTLRQVPSDWRFFAGGGGSGRGYGYQEIGPKNVNGRPTGGRSVVEGALEYRQRFGGAFGGVAFLEAASVSETLMGFDEPQYGAGIGVRYFTDFGPVRVDIATPLNPRPGDAALQFYISIGQAF